MLLFLFLNVIITYMAQYYSLAYIMKTTEDVQPTFSYTPGNTGDVMLAKGPNGGFIRDANINFDSSNNILGVTGQIRTDRVIFDNNNVRLGTEAGLTDQNGNAIAIGVSAGRTTQGLYAVAIGTEAGLTDQSGNAIAIGVSAGRTTQGLYAIAIGTEAGFTDQSGNAIAIGVSAGRTAQGADAIAIGYLAGESSQSDNTIILNATGEALNSVGNASGCYIKPIRDVNNNSDPYQSIGYNTTTGEIVSGTNFGFKLITDNFSVTGGGGRKGEANDNLFAYSYDGVHWEQDETGSSTAVRTFADGSCNAIAYDGTIWLAGGVGETAIVHSANGITWERNEDNARLVLDSGNWRVPVDISGIYAGSEFGTSIQLDPSGNLMAVGAPSYNTTKGIVHIFDYSMNSDKWVNTVDISGTSSSERYGSAVAIGKLSDGVTTRIAVGAPNFNTNNGKVYVFDTSSNQNTWGNRAVYHNLSISNVDASEKFGSALAMNAAGTRLLVGAPANNSNVGAVYSYNFSLNGDAWLRNNSDEFLKNNANGNFGFSIAINSEGNRCLIGEPTNSSGRVYSYDLSGESGKWGLTTTGATAISDDDLSYNPTVVDVSFGHAITMNDAGDWCAVGAPTAGSGRGWVGIYKFNYREWGFYTSISGETAGDNFGSSVVMNGVGDRLIVGAKGYGSGSSSGTNYVYNYNSETLAWDFERDISSNSIVSNQGETLAIDTTGNRIVSGAPSDNTNKGAIVVYDRQMKCNALIKQSGNWIGGGNAVGVYKTQDTTPFAYSADGITNWQKPVVAGAAILRNELFYAPTATNGYFGNACAMNAAGTRLAVGAATATVGGVATKGRVCIYDYDMSLNNWFAEPTKIYEGTAGDDFFGSSVALNAAGDRLVVGSLGFDLTALNRGRVDIYHYNQTTGQWPTTATRYYIGDAVQDDFLGISVAINAAGNRIAMGAPLANTNTTDAGSVFIVDYNETTGAWPSANGTAVSAIVPVIKVNCASAYIDIGASLSFNAAGDVLAIGAPSIVVSSTGSVFIIERDNTTGQWGRFGRTMGTTITLTYDSYTSSYHIAAAAQNTNLGRRVSLNAKGDRLAVSEYEYSSLTGRVYLIHYDYQNKRWWTDGNTINNCSTLARFYQGIDTNSAYGWCVALNAAGDRLIVGSPFSDFASADGGQVEIFDYDYTKQEWPGPSGFYTGKETYQFVSGLVNDYFGGSVAINALGNRIACGAFVLGDQLSFSSKYASDKYGLENGYLRLYDLTTMPIQLADCRALTSFNGNVIAGGKKKIDNGNHIFAISSDNGVTWTNNHVDDEAILNYKYTWSSNSSKYYTNQFFGDTNSTGQQFGYGCAINAKGTRCVIGEIVRDTSKGALFFFHNDDGNGWTLKLQYNNTGSTNGNLGSNTSLAINDVGDRVIAGAYSNDYGGADSGSLYIFDYYDGNWSETKRIDGTTAGYYFGVSCAMNAAGDRFIVGETRYGVATLGFAYIYHYSNGGVWTLAKTYTTGTTTTINTSDKFGASCAMNGAGDRVAVSCPRDETVCIYDYVNGKWITTISKFLTNGTTSNGYGYSCSFNTLGDRLAVGDYSTANGYAYIYHRNNTTGVWPSVQDGSYNGVASGDKFGWQVALDGSGDRVIIGAPYRDFNGTNAGSAYIYSYDYTNSRWSTNVDISFNGLSANDEVGISVVFTRLGHKALIGAIMGANANYGRGYLYEAAPTSASRNNIHCNALGVRGSELIVAGLGGTGVSNPLAWSADGITWYLSDNGAAIFTGSGAECHSVAWNGSRWVAGGKSSGGPLAYSYNGKKWYNSMNSGTLLGATSTCNAVSWNGKYWLASVEGASGGQTQVYSNDGMAWIASNNGDTLFSGTSQALALATVKTGGGGAGASSLESDIATLQAQQIGYNSNLYNVVSSKPRGVYYRNNTSKTITVYLYASTTAYIYIKNPAGTEFQFLYAGEYGYNGITQPFLFHLDGSTKCRPVVVFT
jgi:hypothetical protein